MTSVCKNKMPRKNWVDNLKGICLFLIIIGHFGQIPDCINVKWILAPTDLLYVGMFFYLSGLLFNDKKYSYADFLKQKVKTLLLPYFAISLAVSILDWNLYMQTGSFLKKTLINVLMGDGAIKASPLWFVSTLFCANIILKTGSLIKKNGLRNLFFITQPFVCYLLYDYEIKLPMRIDSALGASCVMYCANYMNQIHDKWLHRICLFCACILGIAGLYFHCGLLNYKALHSWLSFPSAIGGCFFISEMSQKLLKPKSPFIWIAKNGLPILGFHCLILFYLEVPLRMFCMTGFMAFMIKLLFVFIILYFVSLPILSRFHPQLWGLSYQNK